MKISNLVLATALGLPLIAGCATQNKSEVKYSEEPKDLSLKHLRGVVPGIQYVDQNADNVLSEEEIQKYVDAVIINGNKTLTNDQIARSIYKIRTDIAHSTEDYTGGSFGPPRIRHPKNIETTLRNFNSVYSKYLNACYDAQDQVVRQKIEKYQK